jgi:nucleoside-diphosphate-sugar epimerase
MGVNQWIISPQDPILVTGSNGFIGSRVMRILVENGFKHLRGFVRPSSDLSAIERLGEIHPDVKIDLISGNLLSTDDCARAARDVALIFHLAAGIEKTFPGSYLNSVVTTRNLLDAAVMSGTLKRFVNISSFSVYSNHRIPRGGLLDETCALENNFTERYEAYCYGKLKQEELVQTYAKRFRMPYVILRPGAVFGPGKRQLTARVGIDTFGLFMHLGGNNTLPLTYVDNCAEAIVLAGLTSGIDGETFNVVDDHLPASREFFRRYNREVKPIPSVSLPYALFKWFSILWEKYSDHSKGQLPPVFNRHRCAAYWKGNAYSNAKLKALTGWQPRVSMEEACRRFFTYAKTMENKPC